MFARQNTKTAATGLLAIVLALCAARAGAQCWTLRQTMQQPNPAAHNWFGTSLSISGNNVLVGTYRDDTGAPDAGSAYLFDAVSGTLLKTFNNPDPDADDWFGSSVAVSGNNVLVGAYGDDTGAFDAGSAYLFDAVSGALLKTFNNPAPEESDQFGYSVAILGNSVLVGAPRNHEGEIIAGSAYLFDAVSGSLLQTFNNPTPAAEDDFGNAVAVSGKNVLVGAPRNDGGARDAGSTYLFDADSGALMQTFSNPTPAVEDYFGREVSISGNNVIVGAHMDDTGAFNAGSAYLFDAVSGALVRTFYNPAPGSADQFGCAVGVSGNNVLVGAYGDKTVGNAAGSVYLFDATTGSLLQTFVSPAPAAGNLLGWSVAISGNNILAGAIQEDTGALNAGSAYLFTTSACPASTEILDYLLGRTSSPQGLDINTDGLVDAADLAKLLSGAP